MPGRCGRDGGGFGTARFPLGVWELVPERESTSPRSTPCRKGRSHLCRRWDVEAACEPAVRLYLTFYLPDLPCL